MGNTDALQEHLSVCVDEVSSWMKAYQLQQNPVKTEVLWCASSHRHHQIPIGSVRIGDTSVMQGSIVRDLRVYVDQRHHECSHD